MPLCWVKDRCRRPNRSSFTPIAVRGLCADNPTLQLRDANDRIDIFAQKISFYSPGAARPLSLSEVGFTAGITLFNLTGGIMLLLPFLARPGEWDKRPVQGNYFGRCPGLRTTEIPARYTWPKARQSLVSGCRRRHCHPHRPSAPKTAAGSGRSTEVGTAAATGITAGDCTAAGNRKVGVAPACHLKFWVPARRRQNASPHPLVHADQNGAQRPGVVVRVWFLLRSSLLWEGMMREDAACRRACKRARSPATASPSRHQDWYEPMRQRGHLPNTHNRRWCKRSLESPPCSCASASHLSLPWTRLAVARRQTETSTR